MKLPYDLTFIWPGALILALLVVPIIWLRHHKQSSLAHSNLSLHKNLKEYSWLAKLPTILFTVFFLALVITTARPVIPTTKQNRVINTRDIVITVDISSSMGYLLDAPPSTVENFYVAYSRIDAAQNAVKAFVANREGDRIALFLFDDEAYCHSPLTDNLKIIKRKSGLIKSSGGGTNFDGPTDKESRVGALQASINHLRDWGKAKSKVVILVTDGEANISGERLEEITNQMQELKISFYVLGIGSSWLKSDNADTAALRNLVERLKNQQSSITGSQWFAVADAQQLQAAFSTIDKIEKSEVELEQSTAYKDVYQFFVGLSIIFFLLFLGTSSVTREVP